MKEISARFSLILILVALSLNDSTRLAIAQTPTPTTREAPITAIRIEAERQAASMAPVQMRLAEDLVQNNTVGLSPQEIATVYKQEYTRGLQAQRPSHWEALRRNLGWIVAVILLVALAIGGAFRKKVAAAFSGLWDGVYRRLAGNRWLRGLALKRYQRSLVEEYETIKVNFRPDNPLNMRDVYVPLKTIGANENGQSDAYQALVQHRKLVIVGQPGSGKSMLMKHLALTYAEGGLKGFPDSPIPALVELFRLNDAKLTLDQLIIDEFARNDFPGADYFVETSLKAGRLLLLFDGLDEVASGERNRVGQTISDYLQRHNHCRFVLTCRTALYRHEFDALVDKTLEIIDFSDEQIRLFLSSWEAEMARTNKFTEQLMLTLRDSPRIMQIARNPLMLTIITYLYADVEFIPPDSRAEFRRKVTDALLALWHQEQNRDPAIDKSPRLSLQADQDSAPFIKEIVDGGGRPRVINRSGKHQFGHLTLQEYSAAAGLGDDEAGLTDRDSHHRLPEAPSIGDIPLNKLTLTAYLLGNFRLFVGELGIDRWPGGRSRSLCKYILFHHTEHLPREVLMERFWPEAPPESSRNNLNVAMHQLRRAFRSRTDTPVIEYRDGTYSINPDSELWLDVDEFEHHLLASQQWEAVGQLNLAADELEVATSLYQGDLMQDDPYEEWAVSDRTRLRIAYLDMLDRLSNIYFGQGQYSACVSLSQRILDCDNCREDAHRRLMRCFSRQGQHNLALRQYQSCLEALQRELDIGPEQDTIQLAERIRRREHI